MPVANKLADLRSLTRSVATLISKSPTVRDGYFVGDRFVSGEELGRNFQSDLVWRVPNYTGQSPNIFECTLQWSCFWQDRPEDEVEVYRELMASPLFFRIHKDLWFREAGVPRLAAWSPEDEERIPSIWRRFTDELEASANYFYRFEAKAIACADAKTRAWAGKDPSVVGSEQLVDADPGWNASRAALLDFISINYESIIATNVNLPVNDWAVDSLFGEKTKYLSSFSTIQQAYQKDASEQLKENASRADFEKQKHYLANFDPYNWNDFNKTFEWKDYTKSQAAQLKPLIASYKSNLLAQVPATATPLEKMNAGGAAQWIEFYLEQYVNRTLNSSAPIPPPPVQSQNPSKASSPLLSIPKQPPHPVSNLLTEPATNVLTVTEFLPIPLDGLPGDKKSPVTIVAHHWMEGKLLLDFVYNAFVYTFDANTNWQSTRNATLPAIAILDPETERWTVIGCPEVNIANQTHLYHHTTLLHGELYSSDGGQIREYDFKQGLWRTLACSSGNNYELFAVNDRLYAANPDLIFEILNGGKSTRILASSRRQPPVSALDTQDLGTPTLFAGPDNSLRVSTRDLIFTWTGGDWRRDAAAPSAMFSPEIFPEGILFRYASADSVGPNCLTRLLTGAAPELCIGPQTRSAPSNQGPTGSLRPIWKLPPQMFLENLAAALSQSNLYLLAGHSELERGANDQDGMMTEMAVAKDGYNAALFCYSPDLVRPQKVFLNFSASGGCPPLAGVDPSHHGFPTPPPALLVFAGDNLLCAPECPVSRMPIGFQTLPAGFKAGIWMMPLSRLAPAIAAQKQEQLAEVAQAAITAEQARKNLLAKYDLNHDGVIDRDERENALDDPDFIKASLDEIDADHNGWLNARELAWFDANQNKILDPKEQTGIELAQQMLAGKLLDQFDREGNGWLGRKEYEEMVQSCLQVNPNVDFDLQIAHADSNHDNRIDLEELEALIQQRLEKSLRPGRMMRPAFPLPMGMGGPRPAGSGQSLKAAVEAYWQNPGGVTNLPAMGRRVPSGTDNP